MRMRRRENNAGTIYRLKGARRKPYAVRVSTGEKVISATGKVRYGSKVIGTFATYDDAEYALAVYKRSPEQTRKGYFSVADVWRLYRETMEHRKAIGTLYNYDSLWKKLAPIAERDISCLDVIECQSLIDNEPSPSAKAKIKMLIGNLIEFCPTLNITPRQVQQALYAPGTQSKRKKVFTEAEIHRLWDMDSDRYCRALLILLYSGMRIGELHQAEPEAVNMAERYLVGGEKTSAGKNRVIPIRKEIAPLIRDHFAHPRQSLSALRKGVSTFLTGAAMEHTSHEARHTFISRAIQSQVPLPIVQQIVGHSAGNVTLSVYTHLPPAELVRAVDSIHIC